VVDCSFLKSFQIVAKPTSTTENYEQYSEAYRNGMFSYIYGNSTPEEALQQVIDITKYYYVSLETNDSSVGLIVLIINSIIFLIILFSLSFLFIKKYQYFFKFFSKIFSISIISGSSLILSTIIMEYGEITSIKCTFKVFFINISNTLILAPLLNQLIINFPVEINISTWLKNNQILSLFIYVIVDIIFLGYLLYLSLPLKIDIFLEGKNFRECHLKNNYYNIFILFIIILNKVIISLAILLLCFIEWNLQKTVYDVRFIMINLYINIIGVVAYCIVDFMDIGNYILYFLNKDIVYIFFSMNNFMFLYGYRIIFSLIKKPPAKNEEEEIEEKHKKV